MDVLPPMSSEEAAGLEEKLKRGEEVYIRLDFPGMVEDGHFESYVLSVCSWRIRELINRSLRISSSSLWALLMAVEMASEKRSVDGAGWTKLSDALPIINTARSQLYLPLCSIDHLPAHLDWCRKQGVVEMKARNTNGKTEDYVRPTEDLALLRLYVDIAQPTASRERELRQLTPGLLWWEQDAKGQYPPGAPTTDTRLLISPIIERFFKGRTILEGLRDNSNR
jgi:hypothetical protein